MAQTREAQLAEISASIARLEATKARIETLGLESMSGGGLSRNFLSYDLVVKRLNKLYGQFQSIETGRPLQNVKKGWVSGE